MNKDEALKLALQAIEICAVRQEHQWYGLQLVSTARAAIKQALEQPEQETVAHIDHRIHGWPDCFVMEPDPPNTSPLYTSPPQRQPLTDEQLEKGRDQTFSVNNPFCPCDSKTFRKVARWVEAKHGIEEKK